MRGLRRWLKPWGCEEWRSFCVWFDRFFAVCFLLTLVFCNTFRDRTEIQPLVPLRWIWDLLFFLSWVGHLLARNWVDQRWRALDPEWIEWDKDPATMPRLRKRELRSFMCSLLLWCLIGVSMFIDVLQNLSLDTNPVWRLNAFLGELIHGSRSVGQVTLEVRGHSWRTVSASKQRAGKRQDYIEATRLDGGLAYKLVVPYEWDEHACGVAHRVTADLGPSGLGIPWVRKSSVKGVFDGFFSLPVERSGEPRFFRRGNGPLPLAWFPARAYLFTDAPGCRAMPEHQRLREHMKALKNRFGHRGLVIGLMHVQRRCVPMSDTKALPDTDFEDFFFRRCVVDRLMKMASFEGRVRDGSWEIWPFRHRSRNRNDIDPAFSAILLDGRGVVLRKFTTIASLLTVDWEDLLSELID